MIKKILSLSIILGLFSVNILAGGTEGDDADVGGTKVKVSRAIASIPETNDYDADLLEKAKDCAQSIGVNVQIQGQNLQEAELLKEIRVKFSKPKLERNTASIKPSDDKSHDSCLLYAVHRNDKDLMRQVNPDAYDKTYNIRPSVQEEKVQSGGLSK